MFWRCRGRGTEKELVLGNIVPGDDLVNALCEYQRDFFGDKLHILQTTGPIVANICSYFSKELRESLLNIIMKERRAH